MVGRVRPRWTSEAEPGPVRGWSGLVARGGPRRGAELGQQLGHLRVGLVAVGDQLGGGLLIVVAQQALTVLDALVAGRHLVLQDLRGRQALTVGLRSEERRVGKGGKDLFTEDT